MPELPTAICFGNDYMAVGGLSALTAAGSNAPNDISTVGFDDIWMGSLAGPPLTAVRQQIERMAEEAFGLLLDRVVGEEIGEGRKVVLDVELVERQSCKPLRAGHDQRFSPTANGTVSSAKPV